MTAKTSARGRKRTPSVRLRDQCRHLKWSDVTWLECCRWKKVAFHLTVTASPWLQLLGAVSGLLIVSINNFAKEPACPPVKPDFLPIPCLPIPVCPSLANLMLERDVNTVTCQPQQKGGSQTA